MSNTRKSRNVGVTAAACAVFVAAMVGAAYAAVPLYRIFCEVTGYGGTTQRADAAPGTVSDRVITVRFDANVGNGLGWSFRPETREVKVRLGEVGEAVYVAANRMRKTSTGSAVFNVTPGGAGIYFSKIACFCFTEQTLAAGESVDMPVTFFVDPALADDPDLGTTDTITLSYTFYPVANPEKPVAQATDAAAGKAL